MENHPRGYALGFGVLSAGSAGDQPCPGCRKTPLRECAGCGQPTAKVLDARAVHPIPLCLQCWGVVREWKAEARAAKRSQQGQQRGKAAS